MNRILERAGETGDLNKVMELALNPKIRQEDLDYTFYMAVRNNHLHILQYLIENTSVDPTANNNLSLIKALEKGYTDIAKYLVSLPEIQNIGLVPIVESYELMSIDEMKWLLRNLDASRFFADTELLNVSLKYNYLMMIPVLEDSRYQITNKELVIKYLLNLDMDDLIELLKIPQFFRLATEYESFDDITQPVVNYLNRYLPHWRDIPITGRSLQTQSLKKILDLQL